MRELPGTEPVYDLTVADQHEFFAEGVLVHNCVTWRESMDSPDRMDAMVHLHTDLGARSQETLVQGGAQAPEQQIPERLHRATATGETNTPRRRGRPGRARGGAAVIERTTR